MIELESTLTSVVSGELLLFRTIWNNSTDNMFIVRMNDNGEFINESCNRAQAKAFNFTPSQLDNINLKDILDESSYNLIASRYHKCIELNKPITYEESAVIGDEKRYFNTTIVPIVDDIGIRIFGISREITELLKKEQEKLIIEREKNTQMAEMIENIAHQWRQPLSAISTAASGMKVYKESGISNEMQEIELLDNILENTQYLSNTIDMFRNNINEKTQYKEVIIQEQVNLAINMVQASLQNNNILLREDINETEEIKIKTVGGELSEALINIINNAKDILIKNQVSDAYIKITLIKKENSVTITIEDNAGGIDENILPKIFDLYFTTKHKSQGTGLGLYMSKNIIENNLKGKLSVKNSNKGAIFTIELPVEC